MVVFASSYNPFNSIVLLISNFLPKITTKPIKSKIAVFSLILIIILLFLSKFTKVGLVVTRALNETQV